MTSKLFVFALALALQAGASSQADIFQAVRAGDVTRVRALLDARPDLVRARGEQDRTPLAEAVGSKQVAVAAVLIERGADVNAADAEGVTPLVVAAVLGDAPMVRLLLDAGARVGDQANVLGLTALHAATRGRNVEVAELLLARGAPTGARDREGLTPLARAAREGADEIAALLIRHGGPLETADRQGSTPLLLAALSGYAPIVEALVAAGADVNARNDFGNTPWSVAVREGHQAIADALAEAGARTTAAARPVLEGDYLGQPPPGMTARRFAPGVVSTEKPELNAVFTPDGREFYFTVTRGPRAWTIMVMWQIDGRWTGPDVAPFSGTYGDVDLFITPEGKRLYYCSNRPPSGAGEAKRDFDIWVVERAGDSWSAPRRLDAPVNSDADEFYPSLTRDGALYFQSMRAGGGPDLYVARPGGAGFASVERLGEPISTAGFESDPFVAPDGSFLVFSRIDPDGYGRGDLLVSRRGPDGAWSEPENLGPAVNTDAYENCPMLSPDGKYLFFTRDGDIYWVDARVLGAGR
jgi:ankyrin repeat protein